MAAGGGNQEKKFDHGDVIKQLKDIDDGGKSKFTQLMDILEKIREAVSKVQEGATHVRDSAKRVARSAIDPFNIGGRIRSALGR